MNVEKTFVDLFSAMAHAGIYFVAVILVMSQTVEATTYAYPPSSTQCKFTEEGTNYRGTQAVGMSGKTCRMWSLYEQFTESDFGGESVSKMKNYCRAPTMNGTSDMTNGPWCYTTVGKEYCEVQHCSKFIYKSTKQCLLDNGFLSYAGHHTVPDMCLKWTDDIVQLQHFELWQFPGSYSWTEMEDYCRNPDNDEMPWCYNSQVYADEQRLEKLLCINITECSKKCRISEASLEYVGKKDRSETRKPCIPAQDMIPNIFIGDDERRRWFEAKYVNDDYFIPLKECRSYEDQLTGDRYNKLGPVCYVNNTSTNEVVEESCAIHYCRGNADNFTTPAIELDTEELPVDTATSVEVGEAWDVLANWSRHSIKHEPQEQHISTVIGVIMWVVTGLLLFLLMLLDCNSIHQCKVRCKRNSKTISSRLKDLYGSRVSLRSNQISPDSDVVENETVKKEGVNGRKSSSPPMNNIV